MPCAAAEGCANGVQMAVVIGALMHVHFMYLYSLVCVVLGFSAKHIFSDVVVQLLMFISYSRNVQLNHIPCQLRIYVYIDIF